MRSIIFAWRLHRHFKRTRLNTRWPLAYWFPCVVLFAPAALAQSMSPAEMAAMHIGAPIQHGPRGRPLTTATPGPITFCAEDRPCIKVDECRAGGPRPCRKSPDSVVKP